MNKRSRRKTIKTNKSRTSNRSNRSNRSRTSNKTRKKSLRLSKRNNRHSKSKSRNRRKRSSRSKYILKRGGTGYILIKKEDKVFGKRGSHKHDDCEHNRCLMIETDTDGVMHIYDLDDHNDIIIVDDNIPIIPSKKGALDNLNVTQIKQLAKKMKSSKKKMKSSKK